MCDQKAIETCSALGNADAGFACACVLAVILLFVVATAGILARIKTHLVARATGQSPWRVLSEG